MIVKHKLIIYEAASYKIEFIKILKEYTTCGLKSALYLVNLCPSSDYFDSNGEHYLNQVDVPCTITGHRTYLEKNSNFKNVIITEDSVITTFDMDIANTETLKSELSEIGAKFTLQGLSELRDEKINNLLR